MIGEWTRSRSGLIRCHRGTARPRIDFWLGHVFTVGEIHEDLLRWASRSVLMGVVLRTDRPGEKHDEMVVLVGPQGIGKSTAWAWLLPAQAEPQRRRCGFLTG